LLLIACLAACNEESSRTGSDQGGVEGDAGVGAMCGDSGCPAGTHCGPSGVCELDVLGCHDDNGCDGDTYCDCASSGSVPMSCASGTCVPWGTPPRGAYDPSCQGAGFAASEFLAPSVKCHWQFPTGDSGVLVTPIVVDLDKDQQPEIVFFTQSKISPATPHKLVAIRGDNCAQLWEKTLSGVDNGGSQANAQLAAADFDGDGYPELVFVAALQVRVYDHDGNLLASGALSEAVTWSSGPAIANVDNTGPPEIGVNGAVFRYTPGSPSLQKLFEHPEAQTPLGLMSVFADLDGDDKPELVTGLHVYDGVTGADETPSSLAALSAGGAGFPAIADFNLDGKPDLALVQATRVSRTISVIDVAANQVIFGPLLVTESLALGCGHSGFGGGCAGTATIGDFDGDGVPDLGFASSDRYHVYALKCAQTPKPVDCTGSELGELWSKPTKDLTSGGTASSTFDFNGDGIAEAIYRDECFLRVYNGRDGSLLFSRTVTSGTLLEYPVIADVDNDGHADLVVPSDDNLSDVGGGASACQASAEPGQTFTGFTQGIFVLSDPMNRWMPSRPLWTQHSYHITEINDDLSVPSIEPASWLGYNNYRKNVQGAGMAAPATDYTGGGGEATRLRDDCASEVALSAKICNRGATLSPSGVAGTFFDGDPRVPGGSVICTVETTLSLDPGACEVVSCLWSQPPPSGGNVWFRANDESGHPGVLAECKSGNNLVQLPQFSCGVIL